MRPLLILLVMAFAGLLSTDARAADDTEPLRIGLSGAFTGGSSPMGDSMRNGVLLAVAEINAKGGVIGRKIQVVELIERDDEGRNERGVQVAQELINKERVIASLGFINTGVALASQRFYQEAKIPVMTAVATGTLVVKQFLPPEYPDNYVFRLAASDAVQCEMIAREAIDKRKYTKVAILADSTNYGQLGRADLERALATRGVKPVAVEKFNVKDVDMTSQLLRAKNAGAEAILTYAIGPELAQIANGMSKLGWQVPMIGSWTLSMSNFIDNAGPNAEGAVMPQTFIQEGNTPRRKAFIAGYQRRFKVDRIPSPVSAAQGYDSMLILAAAIDQAGVTEGPRLRAALEDLKEPVEGVITTYVKPFTHDNHEAIKPDVPVMGMVKNGHVVYAHAVDKAFVAAPRLAVSWSAVLLQLLFSGISLGMIYAVIAFGYQLTFATSSTLNFGQGESLMLGAMVGLTLVGNVMGGPYMGYLAMIPLVLLFGALQGAVVERIAIKPALEVKSEFGWIMSTISLAIIFKNVAENLWGKDDLKFPSPLSESPIKLLGARVLPMELVVIVGALAMMAAVDIFNRKSIYGKAVVATSNDREAAGLMGINTGRVITGSYALSAAAAALAGVLVGPLTLTGASMGASLGLKAFAVAIIGGLSSARGVIVSGMLLGVVETTTGYYVSTGYKDVPGLVLLLLVLAVKPTGLFGKQTIKKV